MLGLPRPANRTPLERAALRDEDRLSWRFFACGPFWPAFEPRVGRHPRPSGSVRSVSRIRCRPAGRFPPVRWSYRRSGYRNRRPPAAFPRKVSLSTESCVNPSGQLSTSKSGWSLWWQGASTTLLVGNQAVVVHRWLTFRLDRAVARRHRRKGLSHHLAGERHAMWRGRTCRGGLGNFRSRRTSLRRPPERFVQRLVIVVSITELDRPRDAV